MLIKIPKKENDRQDSSADSVPICRTWDLFRTFKAEGRAETIKLFGIVSQFEAETDDPLFHDPRGVQMFMFGVITLFLGAVTMRALIRGATTD